MPRAVNKRCLLLALLSLLLLSCVSPVYARNEARDHDSKEESDIEILYIEIQGWIQPGGRAEHSIPLCLSPGREVYVELEWTPPHTMYVYLMWDDPRNYPPKSVDGRVIQRGSAFVVLVASVYSCQYYEVWIINLSETEWVYYHGYIWVV
ncbi:MAG: hypothetical protein AOA65_0695 [Candidatus Bathyarchaeota archaeon BA1]|nr:MAG: hypothetical protein AOA65_0695 [Candidatus Bathyarchaeota archaeon BA1]